jgi:acetolactate synthase-1/2/3 large subunit
VKQVRRVADLGPAIEEAFAVARAGVQGPVFVECPVDLLYAEATIRQWYAEAAGRGTSIPDRLLRWYLNRHAARMFAGGADAMPPRVRPIAPPPPSRVDAVASALARAQRPLMVIGSQALAELPTPAWRRP